MAAGQKFNKVSPAVVIAKGFQAANGARVFDGAGFPKSGTSGTGVITRTGQGAPKGSVYIDVNTGVKFVNEGSKTSPYWTPVSFDQRGLLGWHTNFRDAVGKALADTAASATVAGSGLRIHGQGIAEIDSGVTVAMDDQGPVATVTTTDEVAHTAVLSFGNGTTPLFQPDQNGTIVMDANIAQSSAITLRATVFGFCGSAADALDPIMTYSGTTISFATTIGDDVAALARSVGLTATDRWFAPHDKANTNASIATTATGVDTGVDQAAAGTYQRLRVECDADGAVRMFIDKAQVASFAAGCLDVDEEIHPILYVESTSTAVKSMLVKHFSAWGKCP